MSRDSEEQDVSIRDDVLLYKTDTIRILKRCTA